MQDSFHERGKSIEDAFFHQRDQQLLEKIQSELQARDLAQSLASVTGISDVTVLEKLVNANIRPESLLALTMIPLVLVAWADGTVQEAERTAILRAAGDNGIETGSSAHMLLESWLKTRPGHELLATWQGYVHALKNIIDGPAISQMKLSVIERAQSVSKASGGILGVGATSESERRVIEELEKAFS